MPQRLQPLLTLLPLAAPAAALGISPAPDPLGWTLLALVSLIGTLLHRYSARYLDGQPHRAAYHRWFLGTLLAVSVLVLARDLRVLAVAWTGSSLALHQLLTFFPDRPASLVAAHKKFLLSRLADVAIFGAVHLIGTSLGTFAVDELGAAAAAGLPGPALWGAALLALGVVLRSAQLPFHGWLIQVMEAPTPVSALLHAGIVNIGGFVVLRCAPLFDGAPAARAVLVAFGALTAVLAVLVMGTRSSVKVALAWSTAAQMGFMLVECGLGAYDLALLHLVAHSLYKAHAFLSSGSVVARVQRARWAPSRPRPTVRLQLGAAAAGAAVGAGLLLLAFGDHAADPRAWLAAGLLALAVTPLFTECFLARGAGLRAALALAPLALAVLYALLHAAAAAVAAPASIAPDGILVALCVLLFGGLFAVQLTLVAAPHGALARRLYPSALAGFHLDELFTRLTFLVWPPRHVRRLRAGADRPAAALRRATR